MITHSPKTMDVEAGLLHTLLYFDIFQYPLTLEELMKFHPRQHKKSAIQSALSYLRNSSLVFKHEQFYSLHPTNATVERRKSGNKLAGRKMITAQRFSRIISMFPFVRGIFLSGSLSKGYMDATSDIDYFIITAPGRLWLTRGLLAIFKRMFLLNSRKYFCTNYLIDSDSLEIEEKNFYTAIEITTLIPVYGRQVCKRFSLSNGWTTQQLPNMQPSLHAYISEKDRKLKAWLELLFSGRLGEALDLLFMKMAVKRWRKQYGNLFDQHDFDIAFKSRRNVSKNHPRFFQKQVLDLFRDKVAQFETASNIKLSA